MNSLGNSRSVLRCVLRHKPTAVSPPRPLPSQAPPPLYCHASRVPRNNAASRLPSQLPCRRQYFFTSPWRKTSRRRRGESWWYYYPRKIITVVALTGGGALVIFGGGTAAIYHSNLEAVPYTGRIRCIILPHKLERLIGEAAFSVVKKNMGPKVLPPLHPESIRVRRIASEIVRAIDRSLAGRQHHEAGAIMIGGSRRKDGVAAAAAKRDDKERRNHGEKLGASILLDGWEVIVVRDNEVKAMCAPGGKIVVYTGLLDELRDDAEIATVLGHEIAHAIARHSAEGITKAMWLLFQHIVTLQFLYRPAEIATSKPFERRLELEADHIGLLLLAAAGYDPRVAPLVYEKLGKFVRDSYNSTHPSSVERAQLLSQADIMNEALELYREVHTGAGHGTDVFALVLFCFVLGFFVSLRTNMYATSSINFRIGEF